MLPPDDDLDPEPPAEPSRFEVAVYMLLFILVIIVILVSGVFYLAALTPTP